MKQTFIGDFIIRDTYKYSRYFAILEAVEKNPSIVKSILGLARGAGEKKKKFIEYVF